MKDYKKIAKQVLELVGGKDNVIKSYFCTTRLRVECKDRSSIDLAKFSEIEGVVSAKDQQGQIQVIIGPDVDKAHAEFVKICPNSESDTDSIEAAEPIKKDSLFTRVTSFIAGIFIPIVPCLAGAGIIQAVLSLLSYFGWIDAASETYIVLNLMQNAVFYFLPFLVAIGAAKQFKSNPYHAVVMAGIMMHPTILSAIEAGTESYHIFGLPILLSDISSTVIPIILSVALLSIVEKWVAKIVPSALRMMLVSGITFIVVGIISLVVFAPIGTYLGNALSVFINWAMGVSSVLGGILLGGLHLPMVITGTHFVEVPLIVQEMAEGAGSVIMPVTAMGNTALVGALIALIIKTKSAKKRGDYSAIMVPTVMGITEPVLYGVAVVLKTPLVWSIIGGAVAGAIVSISGFHLTILGVPGIFAGLVCLGMEKGIWLFIGEIVAIAIGFIGTYLFYKPKGE